MHCGSSMGGCCDQTNGDGATVDRIMSSVLLTLLTHSILPSVHIQWCNNTNAFVDAFSGFRGHGCSRRGRYGCDGSIAGCDR